MEDVDSVDPEEPKGRNWRKRSSQRLKAVISRTRLLRCPSMGMKNKDVL